MEAWRGHFPYCPFKWGATRAVVPFHHRCRSRQIFGVWRIFPEFPQNCPKSFCATFAYKFSSTRSWWPLFWCNLQKKVFMCFHVNLGHHFLKSNNVGRHFYPDFQGICQDFRQINFWGCVCDPCTSTFNTTAIHNSILDNFMIIKIHLKQI